MNKKEKSKKPVLPNQAMLLLRGLIGFYLMYLAYELIRDESMVTPRPVIIIFVVIFVIAGALMVCWVIRSWMRGEYIGGKADASAEEYTETEEVISEEEEKLL